MIEIIEILLTSVYSWSVLLYNVRMLFPSIETGTDMNARESENYLPISRSFSASKQCRDCLGRDISGTTLFQGRDISGTTLNIYNRKQFQFSADVAMYWFPVYHFRCMKFKPLVMWIWYQNIAISTIVGTSSHITYKVHNCIYCHVQYKCLHSCHELHVTQFESSYLVCILL